MEVVIKELDSASDDVEIEEGWKVGYSQLVPVKSRERKQMKKENKNMDKNKTIASTEVKKMKQGMSYTCKEKTIILNVFKYFRSEYPDKCVTELVRRTSKATGCSEKSIFHFRKEELRPEGFKEPSKTKIRKNLNINSRDIKYDNTVRHAIRTIIYDLRYKNISTSLSTILKQINVDPGLPNFSIMTLRRLLSDMGFYYEKNGNKSILMERNGSVNNDNIKKESAPNKKLQTSKPAQNDTTVQSSDPKPIDNTQKVSFNHQNVPIYNNSVPNQYSTHNQFIVPMHLSHNDNHRYAMEFYPSHNSSMIMNTRMPPPHMVQSPWVHPQSQSGLSLSSS